jgi:hypothetical protein
MKLRYQRFTVAAAENSTSANKEFDFDPLTEKIVGVQVTSSAPNLAYFRGSQKIEINGEEYYPEGFETRCLLSSSSVSPSERFIEMGDIEPGNKKLKIGYKDTAHASASYSAYSVTYIFKTYTR